MLLKYGTRQAKEKKETKTEVPEAVRTLWHLKAVASSASFPSTIYSASQLIVLIALLNVGFSISGVTWVTGRQGTARDCDTMQVPMSEAQVPTGRTGGEQEKVSRILS